jgi:hypothetical protein
LQTKTDPTSRKKERETRRKRPNRPARVESPRRKMKKKMKIRRRTQMMLHWNLMRRMMITLTKAGVSQEKIPKRDLQRRDLPQPSPSLSVRSPLPEQSVELRRKRSRMCFNCFKYILYVCICIYIICMYIYVYVY